jgi:hypothetical protein
MLNAQSTHTTSTTAKAANASIMLLTDHRFCITPPYSTARPGTLISPTSVAAVICHAVSPELSQLGASTASGNGSPCHPEWQWALLSKSVGSGSRPGHVPASSVRGDDLDIGINARRKTRDFARFGRDVGYATIA